MYFPVNGWDLNFVVEGESRCFHCCSHGWFFFGGGGLLSHFIACRYAIQKHSLLRGIIPCVVSRCYTFCFSWPAKLLGSPSFTVEFHREQLYLPNQHKCLVLQQFLQQQLFSTVFTLHISFVCGCGWVLWPVGLNDTGSAPFKYFDLLVYPL
jgi:hypothetical protein